VFAQDADTVEQQLPEYGGPPFRIIELTGPHGDRVLSAEHVGLLRALDADSAGEQLFEQRDRSCSFAAPISLTVLTQH
jgi:hypothetical protein